MSLKHAILAVLSSRPRTGYELAHSIDGSIGFFWAASHQQIYKELQGLEACHWVRHREVRQDARPDKKVFRITETGLEELGRWTTEEDATRSPPIRDAFLIKCFVGHLAAPGALRSALEKEARRRTERLEAYLAIEEKHFSTERSRKEPPGCFQYLTLRRGILAEQAWLSWAEEARLLIRPPG